MRDSNASMRRSASRFVGSSRLVPSITYRRTRRILPSIPITSSRYLPAHLSLFFPSRNTRPRWYLFRAIEFSFLDDSIVLGLSVPNCAPLESCDICSCQKKSDFSDLPFSDMSLIYFSVVRSSSPGGARLGRLRLELGVCCGAPAQ